MSSDFTKANPQLEKEIAGCQTQQELADVLLRHQFANGLPNATDRVALPSRMGDSLSQSPEAPKNDLPLLRRAVTVNGVTKIITAYSCTGLDVLEAELKK
jgi:hypothetical protein